MRKSQLIITLQDANNNGKADVTVEVTTGLPFVPGIKVGPKDIPVDEALALMETVAGLLPPAAQLVARPIIGIVRLALKFA